MKESGGSVLEAPAVIPRGASVVTLDTLCVGQQAKVHRLECASVELRNKLLVMGLIEGTRVTVDRVAPFGDPMSVRLLGFTLSLRRSEAAHVWVSPE